MTRITEVTAMRLFVIALVALLLPVSASAQHKIPPLPETASAPVVLPSGLKYIDIKVGAGVLATKGRLVRITFIGWVTKSQLMFDYRDDPNPLAFHLGTPDPNVVKGLDQGVAGMRVGGKRRLIVPAKLGHGSRGTHMIPPNSELTYDVELVGVARPGA